MNKIFKTAMTLAVCAGSFALVACGSSGGGGAGSVLSLDSGGPSGPSGQGGPFRAFGPGGGTFSPGNANAEALEDIPETARRVTIRGGLISHPNPRVPTATNPNPDFAPEVSRSAPANGVTTVIYTTKVVGSRAGRSTPDVYNDRVSYRFTGTTGMVIGAGPDNPGPVLTDPNGNQGDPASISGQRDLIFANSAAIAGP